MLLTQRQLADFLGFKSTRTIYNYERSGAIRRAIGEGYPRYDLDDCLSRLQARERNRRRYASL